MVAHPSLYMFASASPDNIKQWKCPEGRFIQNLSGHNAIVNCMALNNDGVLISGADNGTMHFWDWKTGYVISVTCSFAGKSDQKRILWCFFVLTTCVFLAFFA